MTRIFLLASVLISFPFSAFCCGFNFISSCHSNITLAINGTEDIFYAAPCPFGLQFDQADFGEIRTLDLRGAHSATWESCFNNVSGMTVYYRVYPSGGLAPGWQTFNLAQDSAVLTGPYTTRYRSATPNLNLTDSLIVGQFYTLELFFLAQVDTIGDDFIPETELINNNNGKNYKLSFQYAGPDGPPFTVVPNNIHPARCFGDTSGIAGVSVYGIQTDLFYSWEGIQNNFNTLYNLAAGEYRVTVSGTGGYSEAETLMVTQPPMLVLGISQLQGIGCDGSPGFAAAIAAGGTPGYQYLWSNGTAGSTATFLTSGAYSVTATDTSGCIAILDVGIPDKAPITIAINAQICSGSVYPYRGSFLDSDGNYLVMISGQNGDCDTVEFLTLTVLNPYALLDPLPSELVWACNNPAQVLCISNAFGLQVEWLRDNGLVSADTCITIDMGGEWTAKVILVSPTVSCSAIKTIDVAAPYAIEIDADVKAATGQDALDGEIHLVFSWPNGDSIIHQTGLSPGIYCFTVLTPEGCTRDTCLEVPIMVGVHEPGEQLGVVLYPNPAIAGSNLWVSFEGKPGDFAGCRMQVLNALGQVVFSESDEIETNKVNWEIPGDFPAGPLFLNLSLGGKTIVKPFWIFSSRH